MLMVAELIVPNKQMVMLLLCDFCFVLMLVIQAFRSNLFTVLEEFLYEELFMRKLF